MDKRNWEICMIVGFISLMSLTNGIVTGAWSGYVFAFYGVLIIAMVAYFARRNAKMSGADLHTDDSAEFE